MRHCAAGQVMLPGFEDVAVPEPEPPELEPMPVKTPEPLVIDPLTLAEVKGWKLPRGWTLLPGETVEGALSAWLAMERRGSKAK